MRQRVSIVLAILALGSSVGGALHASDLWLHVRVDEEGGARVRVNLPVAMIDKALAMVPEEHLHHGLIELENHHLSLAELKELWQEIKETPDMTFVTVDEKDEHVRVWKEKGYLRVEVKEQDEGEQVDVRVPLTVVDALLAGEENELDLAAAMQALAQQGEGELVTVSGGNDRVRVWVDRIAEAD